jgi:hypothetical protein
MSTVVFHEEQDQKAIQLAVDIIYRIEKRCLFFLCVGDEYDPAGEICNPCTRDRITHNTIAYNTVGYLYEYIFQEPRRKTNSNRRGCRRECINPFHMRNTPPITAGTLSRWTDLLQRLRECRKVTKKTLTAARQKKRRVVVKLRPTRDLSECYDSSISMEECLENIGEMDGEPTAKI